MAILFRATPRQVVFAQVLPVIANHINTVCQLNPQ